MPLPQVKVVQLTLTNRCQCNCLHCGVSGLRKVVSGELTMEQIHAIFHELKHAGCQIVDLFGGEPTLRSDLFDIISAAKSYGFIVSLETNGLLLDESYVRRLEEAGLDQIYLSLDDYRAKQHDLQRGKAGSFDCAVRALEAGSKSRIIMHVSVVPRSREFFESGDINRFMQFVLERGAKQVRLLLPRFVGDSTEVAGGSMGSGSERELFSHVSPDFADYLYVHTPGTPLGENNICTAKHVFCHIMSNGWVTPCPYFPLVFGDATREPLVDVFERIQSHPLVRLGGQFCPMRNEEYLDTHINKLLKDRPFHQIHVQNQINIGAPCLQGCTGCAYGSLTDKRPLAEVLHDLNNLDREYRQVELFGGDSLCRDDLWTILDAIPADINVSLWTSGRQGEHSDAFWKRLCTCRINAVKILLPLDLTGHETSPDSRKVLEDALNTIRTIVYNRIPLFLYLSMVNLNAPPSLGKQRLLNSGAERIYAFERDTNDPLDNAVACFGRELGRVTLLWAAKQINSRARLQ